MPAKCACDCGASIATEMHGRNLANHLLDFAFMAVLPSVTCKEGCLSSCKKGNKAHMYKSRKLAADMVGSGKATRFKLCVPGADQKGSGQV